MAKKKKVGGNDESTQPSFEDALAKLEQIVHDLEEGELGLGESLNRYENGVKYLKHCYNLLEGAERRIELLADVDAQGKAITEPFDDEDLSLEQKAAARGRRRSAGRTQSPGNSGPSTTSKADIDAPEGLF